MLRPTFAALAALILTAACQAPGGATGLTVDPNPAAPLGEAVSEPTDGAENEIGT